MQPSQGYTAAWQSSAGKEATEQKGWDPDPFRPGELLAEWSPERMGSFLSPWGTVKPRQASSVPGGGGPAPGAHTAFPGGEVNSVSALLQTATPQPKWCNWLQVASRRSPAPEAQASKRAAALWKGFENINGAGSLTDRPDFPLLWNCGA